MPDPRFDPDAARRQTFVAPMHRLRGIAVIALTICLGSLADAQLPNAPILQNVWANAGMVGAVDVGSGSGGSVYAGALSWTPTSGRFQLSGGLGYRTGAGTSGGAYGLRAALPLGGGSSAFGFAAFAGIGGGSAATRHVIVNCPPATVCLAGDTATVDSSASTIEVPVGAAMGWRRTIGGSHGVSVYGTPSFVFVNGKGGNAGVFRVGIGADAGITSALGATVGVELGGSRPHGLGGPSGTVWGLGISYAFSHR